MSYPIFIKFLADVYNCGAYGNGGYNQNQCTSGLASTGTDVAIGIGVGIVLIVVATVLILRSRKKK